MTNRRRFTAEFKARVALEALRGDKTIQQIAAAQGASEPGERLEAPGGGRSGRSVFERRQPRLPGSESEVRDLHAKIGELTVEPGLKVSRGERKAMITRRPRAEEPSMPPAFEPDGFHAERVIGEWIGSTIPSGPIRPRRSNAGRGLR